MNEDFVILCYDNHFGELIFGINGSVNLDSIDFRTAYEIGELEEEIKTVDAEKKRLLTDLLACRHMLKSNAAKKKRLLKKIEFLEEHLDKRREERERIRKQEPFEFCKKYLPHLKRGSSSKPDKSKQIKLLRDDMLAEEMERRKANNPGRPKVNENNPEQSHAHDLAMDLRKAEIKGVGYSTIRKARKMKGNN